MILQACKKVFDIQFIVESLRFRGAAAISSTGEYKCPTKVATEDGTHEVNIDFASNSFSRHDSHSTWLMTHPI